MLADCHIQTCDGGLEPSDIIAGKGNTTAVSVIFKTSQHPTKAITLYYYYLVDALAIYTIAKAIRSLSLLEIATLNEP